MTRALPLAVSTGDPAGIGPVVSMRAVAAHPHPAILYGDADALASIARACGVASARLVRMELGREGDRALGPGEVGIVHVAEWSAPLVAAHAASPELGRAQLAALEHARSAAARGVASALVTAPVSKAAITSGGELFMGQTEYLARHAGLSDDAVTMMFLGPRLNTALVTTHLALAHVPGAITTERVLRATVHLGWALARLRPSSPVPRLAIAGLNPHAGEGGMFGREEGERLAPAVERAREVAPFSTGRVELVGVVPAETAFRRAAEGELAGVVAMYHDQGTIASKLLDWGTAVNVTWGLPFARTSVDHGVAYDAAQAGRADAAGMSAALALAEVLVR